jgi:hypothetical protein
MGHGGEQSAGVETALAIHVPAKLKMIGKNQVEESITVTLELVGLLCLMQALADVLRLDIANGDRAFSYYEIRSAALDMFRLVSGNNTGGQVLYKCLQCWAVGVFGSIANCQRLLNGVDVILN